MTYTSSVQLIVIGNKATENMTRNCDRPHDLIPDRVMVIHTTSQRNPADTLAPKKYFLNYHKPF